MKTNQFVNKLKRSVKAAPKSIILPETSDKRVLKAIEIMTREKSCKEIGILESKTKFLDFSEKENFHFNANELALRFFGDEENLAENAALHYKSMQHEKGKATTDERARMWGQSKTNQAAYLVATGKADCFVSGCVTTTADVIRASLQGVGLSEGIKTLSGSFVMVREEQEFLFADCAIVIDPTPDQLCDIAKASVDTFRSLFPNKDPKVAFLSFSTNGSADHPMTQKVVQGYRLFSEKHPTIQAQGEIQFDAAYVSEIAEKKFPDSNIKGDANIFVFPNLDAGNISYKLCQRIGGFDAYGPLLQGTAKSVSDLSRGASAEDIVVAAYISQLRVEKD